MHASQGMDNGSGGGGFFGGRRRTGFRFALGLRLNRPVRATLLTRPYRLINTRIGNPIPSNAQFPEGKQV